MNFNKQGRNVTAEFIGDSKQTSRAFSEEPQNTENAI
jgi:hypothetical protein